MVEILYRKRIILVAILLYFVAKIKIKETFYKKGKIY